MLEHLCDPTKRPFTIIMSSQVRALKSEGCVVNVSQSPELVARLQRVQVMADNKAYKKMVKNVDVCVSTSKFIVPSTNG